jgi:hypothetical protein
MSLGALRRFADGPPPPPSVEEHCELCRQPIGAEHAHVVNVESRRLYCACRPCYLLFVPRGAAAGKMRAVPERYRRDPGFRVDEASWARLQIPVRTAFFFRNTHLGRAVAFYPSPAGATESQLELGTWDELVAANPGLAELEPDVEAALVHARRGAELECFLVPIDACYELVGRVRKTWRGFDGGEAAWQAIDDFFDGLRARCAGATP